MPPKNPTMTSPVELLIIDPQQTAALFDTVRALGVRTLGHAQTRAALRRQTV
jgi:hypothetical protein